MEESQSQGRFGKTFRSARESSGLGIPELADITKIQSRYIEALESETWNRVPGGVIGRGFVRIIARQIGADSEKLLALYMEARGEEPPLTRTSPPDTQWKSGRLVPKPNTRLIAAILLLILACVATGYGVWKYRTREKPQAKTTETAQLHRLEIKALQNSWVKFKAKGLSEEKNPIGAGETMSLEVEEVEVQLPDAATLLIVWDGVQLKQIAGTGEAARIKLPKELESFKP